MYVCMRGEKKRYCWFGACEWVWPEDQPQDGVPVSPSCQRGGLWALFLEADLPGWAWGRARPGSGRMPGGRDAGRCLEAGSVGLPAGLEVLGPCAFFSGAWLWLAEGGVVPAKRAKTRMRMWEILLQWTHFHGGWVWRMTEVQALV